MNRNKIFLENQQGFTLLEIMVAVLIFGILMLTIFSSFRSFMVSSRMIHKNILQWEKGDALLNIMIKDLRALRIALPPEYVRPGTPSESRNSETDPFMIRGDEYGNETSVNGNPFSNLTFTSLSHIAFGKDTRTGAARIGYYVRANPGQGNIPYQSFDLCRSDTLDILAEMEPSECDPVICRNITEFTLTYHHMDGTEYRYWDSESDEFDYATPVAIHVVVAFKTEGMRRHRETGNMQKIDAGNEREFNLDGVRKIETGILMPLFRKGEKSRK